MRKILYVISVILCIFLTSCGKESSTGNIGGGNATDSVVVKDKGGNKMYIEISPEEAKKIMDSGEEHTILDVREQEEYDKGHIADSVLLTYTEIEEKAEEILPDKNAQILVYCRSGRRSKIAAECLAKLGYTNVKEFGGIIDWPYDKEK